MYKAIRFYKSLIFSCLVFAVSWTSSAQTFCLELAEVSNDGTNLVVGIYIQGSVAFDLGSSNFQFSYNANALTNPIRGTNYLGPPTYQVPTVTTPATGEASFNLELGVEDFGTTMLATPDWSLVGEVSFTITDPGNIGSLAWSYNRGSTQTVVFLDNEATQIFATDVNCLLGLLIALPIDLLTFDGKKVKESVELYWTAASEVNNKGYEIEKSRNGKNWENIGFIEGAGTTQLKQSYNFTDVRPYPGDNYYRLRQIDFNGQVNVPGKIVQVHFAESNRISLFPNPSSDKIFLTHSNQFPIHRIQLFDQQGRMVKEQQGSISSIDVGALVPGTYLLKMESGQKTFFEKVLVLRE